MDGRCAPGVPGRAADGRVVGAEGREALLLGGRAGVDGRVVGEDGRDALLGDGRDVGAGPDDGRVVGEDGRDALLGDGRDVGAGREDGRVVGEDGREALLGDGREDDEGREDGRVDGEDGRDALLRLGLSSALHARSPRASGVLGTIVRELVLEEGRSARYGASLAERGTTTREPELDGA